MTREQTIETYMMNSSKVIAEMLYDTISRYEKQKTCNGCIYHLSANGNIPLSCCECSRFYADNYEVEK